MSVGPFQAGDCCGKYQIVRLLGAGGYGCVYEAKREHPTILNGLFQPQEERVALKCLQHCHAGDRNARERLRQEAVLLMRVKHSNIVRLLECGDFNETGVDYFVMELLEGRTLSEELAGGRFPIRRALEVGYKIADGLAAAHDEGVLHLDLNPWNVFVTERREIKVLDLGAAKYEYSWDRSNPHWPITATHAAPEQFGSGPVDHRADIFAIGEIVYEMLTGQHPFRGKARTAYECAARQLECVARPLREFGVGEEVGDIVHRSLSKKPEDRQESMAALRDALRRAMFKQTEDTDEFERDRLGKRSLGGAVCGAGLRAVLGNRVPTAPHANPLAIFESPTQPNLRRPSVRAGVTELVEAWVAESVVVQAPAVASRDWSRAADKESAAVDGAGDAELRHPWFANIENPLRGNEAYRTTERLAIPTSISSARPTSVRKVGWLFSMAAAGAICIWAFHKDDVRASENRPGPTERFGAEAASLASPQSASRAALPMEYPNSRNVDQNVLQSSEGVPPAEKVVGEPVAGATSRAPATENKKARKEASSARVTGRREITSELQDPFQSVVVKGELILTPPGPPRDSLDLEGASPRGVQRTVSAGNANKRDATRKKAVARYGIYVPEWENADLLEGGSP